MSENNKTTLNNWKRDIVLIGAIINLGLNTIIVNQNEDILDNQQKILKSQSDTLYSIGDTSTYIVDLIKNNQVIIEDVSSGCGDTNIKRLQAINKTADISNDILDVPNIDTSFKSYMDYKFITDKTSAQYILQQSAWTDDNGLRRFGDYYLVAMGTYYSNNIGDTFKITLDTGISFDVMIGDIKADEHTDDSHKYSPIYNNKGNLIYANVIEFIVDTQTLDNQVRKLGTISGYDKFKGNIVSIEKTNDKGEKPMIINVKFDTQMDVKDFCYTAGTLPRNISMKTTERDYDCKSILGMMSLNLSEPVEIIITSNEILDEKMIINKFTKWIVPRGVV